MTKSDETMIERLVLRHDGGTWHDRATTPNTPNAPTDLPRIDAEWIDKKAAWSLRTFGPGERLQGVTKHIEKEIAEVRKDPKDPDEWADLIILAMDGASRQGIDGATLINAIRAKQLRNEKRAWPDWRTRSADEPIEHDRTVAEPR